jgi:DNA-binding XRE family transcriptional regulator
MTQEQLAMLLGVSRQSVAKWESGQSTPEVDKLLKMSELFGCTIDELVSDDLSMRTVAPTEVLPEGAPAEDVCGYDEHMRKFAFGIATGVGIIILGVAISVLIAALVPEPVSEALVTACVLAFVAVGLAFILPAGINHASFAKAHPFVEDFYTPQQKEAEHRSFAMKLTAGITLILLGVIVVSISDVTASEQLQEIASAVLLALVAAGVWTIVHGSIIHGLSDIASYNNERAGKQWERENPRVDHVCGIIMLIATAIGLLLLFGGAAFGNQIALSLFWVSWLIGGIGCGIATLAMRASAGK